VPPVPLRPLNLTHKYIRQTVVIPQPRTQPNTHAHATYTHTHAYTHAHAPPVSYVSSVTPLINLNPPPLTSCPHPPPPNLYQACPSLVPPRWPRPWPPAWPRRWCSCGGSVPPSSPQPPPQGQARGRGRGRGTPLLPGWTPRWRSGAKRPLWYADAPRDHLPVLTLMLPAPPSRTALPAQPAWVARPRCRCGLHAYVLS
jgi:hypothetical protein